MKVNVVFAFRIEHVLDIIRADRAPNLQAAEIKRRISAAGS